jgi:1-aminocyclopropane-1-carboxylate deaminase/D-cysteine desulfhydrase-like pyridoxal-dependent ACC family enzyme
MHRTHLASTPTPLALAPNLAGVLGLEPDRIWLKLDDYTGFGLGGNKVRKLETELSPDRLEGVDTLITCGGPQSNHARVTAAAAAHLGLRCILVINGEAPDPPTGNARLHRLLTPEIVTVADRAAREPAMERARLDVQSRGGRALVIPVGASTGRGALGYALAMVELDSQLQGTASWDPAATWIFAAASSGGTLAGIVLGASLLGWQGTRIVAVSADDPADAIREHVLELAAEAAELIGYRGDLAAEALTVTDAYVGEGYGIPTPASLDATTLFARSEGVLLDPTYTAKAAAGMVDWVQSGRVHPGDRIVFWHTGGQPGLLA